MKSVKSMSLRLIGFFGTKKPINCKIIDSALFPLFVSSCFVDDIAKYQKASLLEFEAKCLVVNSPIDESEIHELLSPILM